MTLDKFWAYDTQYSEGVTNEGMSYSMTCYYCPGAPEGALPVYIVCQYESTDGGGCVNVERERDLPHVVTEGHETRRYPVQLAFKESRKEGEG